MNDSPPLLVTALLPAAGLLVGLALKASPPALLDIAAKASWASLAASIALALLTAGGQLSISPLQLVLSLLTSFVGAIVLSFSKRHMRADPRLRTYSAHVALLLSSVLVLVAANDVLLFAGAWIVSGVMLGRLIGHVPGWVEGDAARRRARLAFLIGDSALVTSLMLLSIPTGSLTIGDILAAAPALPWPLVTLAGALLLVAAAARSALPPFHKWLMGSMTAPTPVSALMHAGVVNAGGFLLIRFAPVLEAAPGVKLAAVVLGAFGALFGIGVMIVRPDIKRALGGSTVAQMSFMIMTCGLGAYAAALWHLIAHGLFKSWAFLGAGSAVGQRVSTAFQPWTAPAAIMTGALGLAVLIASLGVNGALLLPLPIVLATISALVAFAGLARSDAMSVPAIGAMALALVASYLGGAVLVGSLQGLPVGTSPLPIAGQVALLATFLFSWFWQAARLPLPATLYIRLLNTGGPALIR